MNKHLLIKVATLPTLVMLLLVTFVAFGAREGALADENVPTGATIGGAGALPVIECAWILPDAVSTAGAQTMQYGNDDNLAQPAGPPCTSVGSAPATQASVAGPPAAGQIHIHVNPNPEDKPNTQLIELWGAIDPPSGTASAWTGGAFWKVYHPNGTLKVQVESIKVTPQGGGGCGQAAGGIDPTLQSMLNAAGPGAGNTGQLSSNAIANIIALCQQNGKALYHGTFELHKYQPCGDYKVEFVAPGGATNVVLTYWFNVPCIFQLAVDFSQINWGTIIPGQTGQVLGDTTFVSPLCVASPAAPCPTVKNTGNSGMGLRIQFTDLVQCSDSASQACPDPDGPVSGPKKIVDFDGCFGRTPSTIECQDPAPATPCTSLVGLDSDPNCNNKIFTFGTARDQTLCANEVGKLDLSIHPVSGLPAGNYQGSLTVTGIAQIAPAYCGENGAATNGNINPGS